MTFSGNSNKPNTINDDAAEAALCIWEAALEDRGIRLWLNDGEGVAQGRSNAIKLGGLVDFAYEIGQQVASYDGSFDVEFVPNVVLTLAETGKRVGDIGYEDARRAGILTCTQHGTDGDSRY